MIKRSRCMTMWVCLLSLAAIGTATLNGSQGSETLSSGAVYLLTNQIANAVAVFQRAPDGTLTPAGTFPTGGSGNPVSEAGDPPFDPLASQGALILSHNKRLLFAVNAGSNELIVIPTSVMPAGSAGPRFAWLDPADRIGVRMWYVRVLP